MTYEPAWMVLALTPPPILCMFLKVKNVAWRPNTRGRSGGWGTWIRTKILGVRVRCSTVELSPNKPLKYRSFLGHRPGRSGARHGCRPLYRDIIVRGLSRTASRQTCLVRTFRSRRQRLWPPPFDQARRLKFAFAGIGLHDLGIGGRQCRSDPACLLGARKPNPVGHLGVRVCAHENRPRFDNEESAWNSIKINSCLSRQLESVAACDSRIRNGNPLEFACESEARQNTRLMSSVNRCRMRGESNWEDHLR
jgi:hypothetical protein